VKGLYVVRDGGRCMSGIHDGMVIGPTVIDHRSSSNMCMSSRNVIKSNLS
jgi:hypothetical protein